MSASTLIYAILLVDVVLWVCKSCCSRCTWSAVLGVSGSVCLLVVLCLCLAVCCWGVIELSESEAEL